jgi:putative phage-type endonuclease
MSKTLRASRVDYHLARSGGRLACPHPVHRFAQVPDSPARIILPECAGREAWLAARQEGIGGSEVGALVGVSEYETPFSVWNTKKGEGKDLSDVPAVEWGHRWEDVVGEKTAQEIGLVSRFAGGLWADREKPFLRVTPDRFATKPRSWRAVGVIECKTAGDDDEWESGSITAGGQGTGQAPLSYQAQIQWQMGILGLPKGWLGCYVSNRARDFYVVEVDFNPEWFNEMAAEAERFHVVNILGDEPPMHDLRHPKTEELLKLLHPKVVKPSVDLPEDTEEWLADYLKAKDDFEKAKTELDRAKNYFRMMTGDAGAGYLPWPGKKEGLKITSYPEVTSTRVNIEKLWAEFPDVADACTERSSYRRLTISVPKEIKKKLG